MPNIELKQVDEACELYQNGLSQQMIATQFDCSISVTGRSLRERGLMSEAGKKRSGPNHWSWSGGRQNRGGYIWVWISDDDPMVSMRNRQGYVAEHRLVMARQIGRPLAEHETVHHINGDGTCNEPSNLQLRQGLHGMGVCYRCADCGSLNVVADRLKERRAPYG